jgi:hypothetical protein
MLELQDSLRTIFDWMRDIFIAWADAVQEGSAVGAGQGLTDSTQRREGRNG